MLFKKKTILDYQRLFEVGGMPFFVNDTLVKNYSNLNAVFLFDGTDWIGYLPRSVVDKTLDYGVRLLSSPRLFSNYVNEFDNYVTEFNEFIESFFSKDISKANLEKFLNYIVLFHTYYIKTEFFYVDRAFKKDCEITKTNLSSLANMKNARREDLNKVFFGNQSYINRCLNQLSEKFEINFDLLQQYTHEELLALFNDKEVKESILFRRKQAYFTSFEKNKTVLIGVDAKKQIASFKGQECPLVKEIFVVKGTPANKGLVRGNVNLFVYGYNNFDVVKELINKMKEGEILVAETTSPELFVACKKAAAIITNQGGLLSHAAIVSRELGIPCIVGTGNATTLLKDGDLVEVDANKGIVKLIR